MKIKVTSPRGARLIRAARQEICVWQMVWRDARTPPPVKWWLGLLLAYALSPIDLIPDFIPVLGHLDDALILPLGLALARRLVPPVVISEAREKAARQGCLSG